MPYFFDVYGPFPVNRTGKFCTSAQPGFWRNVEENNGLSSAIGCYLFCIKHGSKISPWYIGMTVAQTGFKQEIFTPHKINIYNGLLAGKNGVPVIFLFPLFSASEARFSRAFSSGKRVIAWLEKMLMAFAYAQNPEIANTRDMYFLKNTTVRGVFGEKSRGRPHAEVTEARVALFGRRRTTGNSR